MRDSSERWERGLPLSVCTYAMGTSQRSGLCCVIARERSYAVCRSYAPLRQFGTLMKYVKMCTNCSCYLKLTYVITYVFIVFQQCSKRYTEGNKRASSRCSSIV